MPHPEWNRAHPVWGEVGVIPQQAVSSARLRAVLRLRLLPATTRGSLRYDFKAVIFPNEVEAHSSRHAGR